MIDKIKSKAEEYFPEIQAIRHHIHANPELSFEEYKTAEFISSKLTEYGIEHETGVAGTGVIGLIKGKNPDKKCIALRADMDALPIQEANDVAYKSKNDGVMHACGHDVHSSCLLGVAKILHELRDEWEGTVKLIFQQGEEKHPGGASLLIKAGVLENPKPEAIFALHVYPHMPSGTVGFRAGQYMASTDEVYITINGKGGHAALPHKAIDPIAIGAQVITGLQQIVSRKGNPITPTVLSFCKIESGFTTNVIPDKLELWGTLRTMNEEWRAEAHRLIKEFTTKTCEAYGATAEINIPTGHASLFNDPEVTANAESWAKAFLGDDNVKTLDIRMTGEDFSFYTLHMPGCFFRLGTNKNDEDFTASVHNAHFNIDEEALKTGVGTMSWIAVNALMS
ncbi:MAG: amidohydrolase [Chitinophagales bacterium]|nr:amidohydrolase [Chitinophagaceae bacterium]MCB9064865.1 amidohydrolase [Chitinophagales bacterium]